MEDPAVPLIRQAMRDSPELPIRILSGAPKIGSNQKVTTWFLARTGSEARDYCAERWRRPSVAGLSQKCGCEFADPAVGVVSCFYRGIAEENFWAEVEAVGAASDFFAGALVANLPGRVDVCPGRFGGHHEDVACEDRRL